MVAELNFQDGIVDAHHHIWNPVGSNPDVGYKWLRDIGAPKPFGDPTSIQRDYLWPEFLAEAGGQPAIAGSVHVQADGAIPDPVAETAFVQAGADALGHPLAIVGFVDLSNADSDEVIKRHRAYSSFRGVRQILSRLDGQPGLSFAGEHYLRNEAWREAFARLAEQGLSFDAQLYPEQMEEAAFLFAAHRDIAVIIDHAGSPHDQSEAGLRVWRSGLSALAQLPHVSIKLSGFGMFNPSWDDAWASTFIGFAMEAFGEDRVMFGSNYPVESLAMPYGRMLEKLVPAIAAHGDPDKVFRQNARRIYRF